MTLVPEFKICPKCKKRYSWNPDVGEIWCPKCGPIGAFQKGDTLKDLLIEMMQKKR